MGATAQPKSENIFLEKAYAIGRKGIFALKFYQTGWTEQSKVVSECILKCSFFVQTDVPHEQNFRSFCYTCYLMIQSERLW